MTVALTKKQKQIYNKCKNRQRKEQRTKDYAQVCIKSNVCPCCGDLLRCISGVLEDECCAGNTAFMGVYACSSSKCNFLFGNRDMEELRKGDTEFINGKKLLSKEEKRRIRIAKKIDETSWSAPICY